MTLCAKFGVTGGGTTLVTLGMVGGGAVEALVTLDAKLSTTGGRTTLETRSTFETSLAVDCSDCHCGGVDKRTLEAGSRHWQRNHRGFASECRSHGIKEWWRINVIKVNDKVTCLRFSLCDVHLIGNRAESLSEVEWSVARLGSPCLLECPSPRRGREQQGSGRFVRSPCESIWL